MNLNLFNRPSMKLEVHIYVECLFKFFDVLTIFNIKITHYLPKNIYEMKRRNASSYIQTYLLARIMRFFASTYIT